MTAANLARAMQLSPPTVHEMIGRLERDGYVARDADKSLRFTDNGLEHAEAIVSRHRLIERFLTDVLGIPWDEVHEEAERIEHAMSPVLEERMRVAIGDAKTCPHGHPIKTGDRETGRPARRLRGRRQGDGPALRERGRRAAALPPRRRLRAGSRREVESSDETEVVIRSAERQPRGFLQRRRDRLRPRRPGPAAPLGASRAARALARPLRSLTARRPGAGCRGRARVGEPCRPVTRSGAPRPGAIRCSRSGARPGSPVSWRRRR